MQSLGDDRNNSFDLIRLILAAAVLLSHCYPLALGSNASEPLYRITGGAVTMGSVAVFGFFILSGYLITASASRCSSMRSFVLRRALRILPGYFLVCVLAAVLLVPLFTSPADTLPVGEKVRRFFTATLTLRQFELPGVFSEAPFPNTMNGSLWTIRYEVACYGIVAALLLVGIVRSAKQRLLVIAMLICLVAVVRASNLSIDSWVHAAIPSPSKLLMLSVYFLVGALAYCVRERLPHSKACLVLSLIGMGIGFGLLSDHPWASVLVAISMSYALLWLAATQSHVARWISARGDYSYGLYIFAFPVQQVCVTLLPVDGRKPLVLFAVAIVPVLLLAVLSWHFVEKPAMSLAGRRRSKTVEPHSEFVGALTSGITGTPLPIERQSMATVAQEAEVAARS